MAGSRIQFRMQDRTLSDLSCDIIEGIDIDVVHAEVCRTQIFVVARHLHALYMRPEIALRDTAQSLEEELVCDLADTAVFAQTQHRDLTVVIAAHEEVFIVIICGKMRSAHTVDGSAVDLLKIASLDDLECFHAEVRDGIQETAIVGNCHIGGIRDGDLTLFAQCSLFYIDIIHPDADLFLSGPGIGRNISNKLVSRYVPVS